MVKYFQISDPESVTKIDKALEPIDTFNDKMDALVKKYNADGSWIFNTADFGVQFSYLFFKKNPTHLDIETEFKISPARNKKEQTDFEVRPRKSNKKFYAEFNQGLENVTYDDLKLALFGDKNVRPFDTKYIKIGQNYFIQSGLSVVLPHTELTATEYEKATKANK